MVKEVEARGVQHPYTVALKEKKKSWHHRRFYTSVDREN